MNPCKRMNVFAIGLDKKGNIVSARNGNLKECTKKVGNCGCIHAEELLLKEMKNPKIVVISHAPCLDCAKLLAESGVEIVYYIKEYRKTEGKEFLLKNHIPIMQLTEVGVFDEVMQ